MTNDRETAHATHRQGVQLLITLLHERHRLQAVPASEKYLPKHAYQLNSVHRIDADGKVMPRDLLVRLSGTTARVKVHAIRAAMCSSLYRSVAYQLMDDGPYLQVVMGPSEREFHQTMHFLDNIQGDLDPKWPDGIRHVDYLDRCLFDLRGQAA